MNTKMEGIWMILDERERQIHEEGWTPEHDDRHTGEQLRMAAKGYAHFAHDDSEVNDGSMVPPGWPFGRKWWKPAGYLKNLVKAGALLAAEIDRVLRQEPKNEYSFEFAVDSVSKRKAEELMDMITAWAEENGAVVGGSFKVFVPEAGDG